jgi:hypothetical protein
MIRFSITVRTVGVLLSDASVRFSLTPPMCRDLFSLADVIPILLSHLVMEIGVKQESARHLVRDKPAKQNYAVHKLE